MKKILFGILIVSFSLLLIIGCGKAHPGGGATPINNNINSNANTSSLYIVWSSCTPTSGETNVNANTSVVIKFNNPLATTEITSNSFKPGLEHTAGAPKGGTFILVYDENNTKVTLSGITGWTSAETEPNPPFQVQIASNGIKDIYGNSIATDEVVADFTLATEFWRYFPNLVGTIKTFNVLSPFGYDVISTWEITGNTIYPGYTTFEAVITSVETGAILAAFPGYAKSNNSVIRFILLDDGDPADYTPDKWTPDIPLVLNNGFSIGSVWPETISSAGDTVNVTTEVLSLDNISFNSKILPCYRIRTFGGGNLWKDEWLAYNYGIMKSVQYSGYTITYEAIECVRP